MKFGLVHIDELETRGRDTKDYILLLARATGTVLSVYVTDANFLKTVDYVDFNGGK